MFLPVSRETKVSWRRAAGVRFFFVGRLHRGLSVLSALRPDDQLRLFHFRRASAFHRREHDRSGAGGSAAHQPTGVPENPFLQIEDRLAAKEDRVHRGALSEPVRPGQRRHRHRRRAGPAHSRVEPDRQTSAGGQQHRLKHFVKLLPNPPRAATHAADRAGVVRGHLSASQSESGSARRRDHADRSRWRADQL